MADLGEDFLHAIWNSLSRLPLSRNDLVEYPARIRQIRNHDVVFLISRDRERIVATVIRIWPSEKRSQMREILKRAEIIAILRGSAGI